ncbi:gliding motility-associated C-terminal domain-containing protein [Hymenobacter convexus]|uniref:gliding motility-associated C-terminal domain-containing protein n=1 Tax=Hymenobacter sp. CA1UV-4 TaxID=3063782 RepID=UPI0027127FBF|nr:gliding motility-associated C-terminal domain-containing protein [Hymenobacter sp. CA1UV-4]MDO7854460.1 gliding motility-associated C-terminal domain-containing protein [Hymenobacter sp. CA1UV-4]
MRKILHSFTLLLFACGLLMGSAQEARASHLLGGDMTYVSLGNNQYRVKFRLYRDCSGITPSQFDLSCKNGGCSATASVTTPFVQQGAVEAGNPFCAAVSAGPCQGPAGLPNYDVYNYLATVTLPPGQWILSTFQNARPALANINAGDLYVEATLDNRNQGTTAVANNSPQFDPQDIPIQYVCWKQRTTITFSSTEADGDSLVYSLAAPLQACGTPATYLPYPGSAPIITPITCPGGGNGFFSFGGIPGGTYSPTNPIQLGLDTVGSCPLRTGVARTFNFNQQSRTITFTPGIYTPAAVGSGTNKYQIAVLITEYRRINGVRRVIGTVRREANLIVIDCGGNSTPNPVQANPVTTNAGTGVVNTADTTRIDVRSCNYSRVELNFTDPDNLRTPSAGQLLTVTTPVNINTDPRYLDSGDVGTFSLTGNGTTNPKGVFFFQPSPATVGRTILLSFKVEDNACPIKGVQNRVVVLRIVRGNVAQAVTTVGAPGIGGQVPPSICLGGSLTLQGNVLRPDSIRRIATNTTQAQVYTFQWTTNVGGNGLPAVTNTRNIVVNPTVTTRYLLRIAPTIGFAQGVCGDTTSVLVRVVPQPIVSIRSSVPTICSGTQVVLTATTTRPAGVGSNLNDVYTYRWSGPGVTASTPGVNTSTLTVSPTTTTTYTVAVTGASPYGCANTTTSQITIVPRPAVSLRTSSAYVCSGSPATLTASATPPTGFPDTYTYRFAPANGLATADLTKANPTVTPTVTTRYFVTISGNPLSGCADTTSVVVRVLPTVTAAFTSSGALDAPVNGKATSRPPVYFNFTNTTNSPAGISVASVWTYQRVRDILGDAVSESPVTFSSANTPTPLQLTQAGYYTITLTTTPSGFGQTCAPTTAKLEVFVPDLQIPNIITPNGDQQNDVFKVSTANTNSKLEIYNRWGRKVYETTNYANNWGGDNQPAGVYYYLLTNSKGAQTKGWLEVVR